MPFRRQQLVSRVVPKEREHAFPGRPFAPRPAGNGANMRDGGRAGGGRTFEDDWPAAWLAVGWQVRLGGQFSTKSSSTSSSHVSLPPPSLPPSVDSRLVNELVIDSMNWNPNLSLFLFLVVVSLISFGGEFFRSRPFMESLALVSRKIARVQLHVALTHWAAAAAAFSSFPFNEQKV